MHHAPALVLHLAAAGLLALAPCARAQAPASAAGVYRCGSSYSATPCPGGQAVQADDPRSEAQRQQALAVKQQDRQLAQDLAAERRARENAATGQKAGRLGPTEAERAQAAKAAAKAAEKKKPQPGKKKRKPVKVKPERA